MNILSDIISSQKYGSHIGASSNIQSNSRHSALVLFSEAKLRLLDINNWGRLYEASHAEFRLTDEFGTLLQEKTPKVGNLIRMRLPITDENSEEHFSWVRIIKFESAKDLLRDQEEFGFCVRPVSAPISSTYHSFSYPGNKVIYLMLYRKASNIIAIEQEEDKVNSIKGGLFTKVKKIIFETLLSFNLPKSRWSGLVNGILRPSFN